MSDGPPTQGQDIVLIGATGDLARSKLLPALYHLHLDGLLPRDGMIVGYAQTEMGSEQFRRLAEEAVFRDTEALPATDGWRDFQHRLHYVSARAQGMGPVADLCRQPQRLVYLATPPSAFAGLVGELGRYQLVQGTRLVVEKPFGRDAPSGRDLDEVLHQYFDEQQIFRIDHFMGKETVQNILVFRFGNALFERVWHREAIDHMQITVAESEGVGSRGAFYEEVGAIRDILQNHVLQVLALLTMEPPLSFSAEAIHNEKHKVLHAIPPPAPDSVVLGQYTDGVVGGARVPGYRREAGVASVSPTETYAALRLHVDNWRWSGVPFFIRTGKRLPRRVTEVQVQFRDPPVTLFEGAAGDPLSSNHITLRIQPAESITLSFLAKEPGHELRIKPGRMHFSYADAFGGQPQRAYERLLLEALDGDRTLFIRSDEVRRSWEIVQPLIEADFSPAPYSAGTWGPREADALISPRDWHLH